MRKKRGEIGRKLSTPKKFVVRGEAKGKDIFEFFSIPPFLIFVHLVFGSPRMWIRPVSCDIKATRCVVRRAGRHRGAAEGPHLHYDVRERRGAAGVQKWRGWRFVADFYLI